MAGSAKRSKACIQGRVDEVAELLALHYERSDDADKAVDYAILAAEKAQRRWANAEALSYFEGALRRLDGMPDTPPNRLRRIDAVVKQVEVKLALGRHAEHIDGARWHTRHRRRKRGPAPARQLALLDGLSRLPDRRPSGGGDRALPRGGDDRRDAPVSTNSTATSNPAWRRPTPSPANCAPPSTAGERARAIFEARGNRWYASRALWHLSTAANYLGEWEASLSYCRRAFEHGVALEDIRLKGIALWRTGSAHIQRGDAARGCDAAKRPSRLIPTRTIPQRRALIRGYGLIKSGDIDRAIAELADVADWFERSRLPYIRSLAMLWLAEGHLARRDHATARAVLDQVVEICRSTGYVHYEALAYRLFGECRRGGRSGGGRRRIRPSLTRP